MGFKLNINNILRQDMEEQLEVGKEYPFEKSELTIIADDIQIWLTKKDWTVLADIQITSQTRSDGKTSGTYVVKHIYEEEEQKALTNIFRRMYGWE
jgi:hypothetical protein